MAVDEITAEEPLELPSALDLVASPQNVMRRFTCSSSRGYETSQMMPMKTTHVVRLALDLDLVIVGLEERGGARPTIAGGALAVAATKVREGRLDVERVRCDQADVRRRTRTGRRGVHKRHLEERAVLSVEAAVT